MIRHWVSYAAFLAMLLPAFVLPRGASAADDSQYKTAGGISVYLGVVPAGIVKGLRAQPGEKPMHGGVPSGPHEYHIIAAVFDASTGARIANVSIAAQVSGLGLAGPSKQLEPMQIAGTTTFGAFFDLPGPDIYTIKLSVQREDFREPVVLEFKFDHRRQF